jgi:hypothetical protein
MDLKPNYNSRATVIGESSETLNFFLVICERIFYIFLLNTTVTLENVCNEMYIFNIDATLFAIVEKWLLSLLWWSL